MATGNATVTVTYQTSAPNPHKGTNRLTKITVNGVDYKIRAGKVISSKLIYDLLAAAGA